MTFCPSNNLLCYLYLLIGIIPIIHLIYIFFHNLNSPKLKKKKKHFQSRQNDIIFDWNMIASKFIIALILILTSFLQLLLQFLFHSHNLYFVQIVLEFCNIINLISHLGFIVYDAQTFGQTTLHVKVNYLITILCWTIIVYVIYNQHMDLICVLVAWIRCIILIYFFIHSSSFDRNYISKDVIFKEYSILYENEYNDPIQEESKININESLITFQPSSSQLLQTDYISDISIQTFKESQKYEKRTIIYQIHYKYENRQRVVYRSFREFLNFYNDLKVDNPDQILPIFPKKKEQNQFLTLQDIEQRRDLLDGFLKGIHIRFNNDPLFSQFLNVKNDSIQYTAKYQITGQVYSQVILKRQQKRISGFKQQQHQSLKGNTYGSIPETIWEKIQEDDEDSFNSCRKLKKGGSDNLITLNSNSESSEQDNTKEGEYQSEQLKGNGKLFEKENRSQTYEDYQQYPNS